MVRIRLRRVGGRNQPSFRIVATEKESPSKGRFIEVLGFYNPRTEPATIQLKEERIYEWISKGARPSDSAMQIFKVAGLAERYERFKSGEKVEKLLAEAETGTKSRKVNHQTRRPEPAAGTSTKKKVAKAAVMEAAPKAAAETAPVESAPPVAPAVEGAEELPAAE